MGLLLNKSEKEQVNVLIMEDDFYYNDLLAQKIRNLQENDKIKKRFQLNIKQFNIADNFLQSVENVTKNNVITIALIDYYLGYGINGMHLVYLLNELKMNIKVILMSQSEKVINELDDTLMQNIDLIKLQKHNYTPDICCTIIENYISNI